MKRPLAAVIEDVIVQPDKIQPILVSFQNGQLKDEEAKKMECGLFDDEKRDATVLALSNGKVVYKGYRPDPSKELTHTMLAVYNKKTGKVRLIGTERWNVAPILDQELDVKIDQSNDKHAIVSKEFGSKKMKRRTLQYEKMKVNVEAVKETLEKTVSNIEIDRQELTTSINDDFRTKINIPPCNREASKVSQIYNIYDIIPKITLKLIYDTAVEIIQNGFNNGNTFFMETLQQLKSSHKCKKKVAILLYIKAVSTWMSLPFKDIKKTELVAAKCSVPDDIITYIYNNYSIPCTTGRQRPPTMKDKAIAHCMILALTICDYSLNLELFITAFQFRLGIKKLLDIAKIIGAVSSKDKRNIIILKLPLPAPVPIVMMKRSRKK